MFPLVYTGVSSSILSWVIFTPLLGAVALLGIQSEDRGQARLLALFFAGSTLILSLVLIGAFEIGSAQFQFVHFFDWMPSIGANYIVGIDGISLWLVVLTALLSLLVVVASTSVARKLRGYLASILILETGMLGTLSALDAISFYVFWELMLIPMYFLIGVWGGERRVYAAIKFVLFTALGSLLMLVAIVYCGYQHWLQFGHLSFLLSDWVSIDFALGEELLVFGAFALAFAIKIPVFPLHTWLPDAHVEAPTGGSVILAGILLKLGLYGLIRFGMPVFPTATFVFAPLFIGLGVFGIIYGALCAWVQTDLKKLVAYSSISHLGFCVMGYAVLSFDGLQGCLLQMINHGISTAALFFIVGVLYERTHSRRIADYGGIAAKVPAFAAVYLVFTLSSIGLPLTNGFVGELLILLSGFDYNFFVGVLAVSGIVLGAVYMLSVYRRIVFGPFKDKFEDVLCDLRATEKVIFAPLAVLVFAIGLYPSLVLDTTYASSRWYVDYCKAKSSDSVANATMVPSLSYSLAALGVVSCKGEEWGNRSRLQAQKTLKVSQMQ
jgi:NADH-quinone oxidoreductase subunit M